MNSKSHWFWLLAAAGLLGFIFVHNRFKTEPVRGPLKVLPGLKGSEIVTVQVRPKGQLEIRANREERHWQLTEPVNYPAQSATIENLLKALESLTAATHITAAELKHRPKADEDYGFPNPLATLILRSRDQQTQVLIGALTAPGDQVFVQVVGVEAVHVVDAALLQSIPKSANDWRDTALIRTRNLAFDGLVVTHAARAFDLRKSGDGVWKMVSPIETRADTARIQEALQRLEGLEISRFVSDDPGADPEAFGLQPPGLELSFKSGTNALASLQFGGSPTNDPLHLYARRAGQDAIVLVPKDSLAVWRGSVNDFREPHLLNSVDGVKIIEVQGVDQFSLVYQETNQWRVLPQDFPADPDFVREVLATLGGMQITEFTKDIVTPMDFPNYGLANPRLRFTLRSGPGTNEVIAQLDFGTNLNDRVFARRQDESSVYAVQKKDSDRLPSMAVQARKRQIWGFTENDLAQVTIRQGGKVRQMVRKGPHDWALAPGSQGSINELAVEESVRPLCRLEAAAWMDRGEQNRARYGFEENGLQITLELKNGEKPTVFFGGPASPDTAFAGVNLGGDFWIFEFPPAYFRFIATYLTIPAGLL